MVLIYKTQVIEWCTHHRDDPITQDDQERRNTDIDEWDQKYMEVDQETLFDIILVLNHFFFFLPIHFL